MSTKEDKELDTELLVILADYSNDLHNVKMRDGELPAQAAVKRIKSFTFQKALEELEQFHFNWASQFTSGPKRYLEERIAALKQRVKGL